MNKVVRKMKAEKKDGFWRSSINNKSIRRGGEINVDGGKFMCSDGAFFLIYS